MKVQLATHSDSSYEVCFHETVEEVTGEILKLPGASSMAVVMGENVRDLYGEVFMKSLKTASCPVHLIVIPSGEDRKTIGTVEIILNEMQRLAMDRKSILIAVGGGVTGDITGFAASIVLRGIRFVQVPTTLLACVDASVGGKTGVNTDYGKNLVGTFHQPTAVHICPVFLNTLDEREWRSGLAEVIKIAVTFDEEFVTFLEQHVDDIMKREPLAVKEIIERSVQHKIKIVDEDERETGVRRLLNFGHTLGHAIEVFHDYKLYTHGEAVALGMVFACKLSEKHAGLSHDATGRIVKLMNDYGLPTTLPEDLEKYYAYIHNDKKAEGNAINWVLLHDIGKARVEKLTMCEIS